MRSLQSQALVTSYDLQKTSSLSTIKPDLPLKFASYLSSHIHITSTMLLIPILVGLTVTQANAQCPRYPNVEDLVKIPANASITKCNSKQTKCWFSCEDSGLNYGNRFYNSKNDIWRVTGKLQCKNGVFTSNLNRHWSCAKVPGCFPPDVLLTRSEKYFNFWMMTA